MQTTQRWLRCLHFLSCAAHQNTASAIAIYAEKDEPQPQVEVALGFLMVNCEPSILST